VFAAQIERWTHDGAGDADAEASAGEAARPRLRRRAAADLSVAVERQRPARPRVELMVDDAEDVKAAQLLFRSIYAGVRALEGTSQALVLSVLRLADRFQVNQTAVAAGRLLQGIPTDQIEWSTVEALFSLPEACLEAPAFRAALQAARNKLQQQLGDLDAAMGNAVKRQQLLSLPLTALCALLRDDRTRASCEDTALAVATFWCHKRWGAKDRGEDGAALGEEGERELQHSAARLAGVVRLGRLHPVVLLTVAARSAWVQAALAREQLLELTAFAATAELTKRLGFTMVAAWLKSSPSGSTPAGRSQRLWRLNL
jgi:hypothetical protein